MHVERLTGQILLLCRVTCRFEISKEWIYSGITPLKNDLERFVNVCDILWRSVWPVENILRLETWGMDDASYSSQGPFSKFMTW